MKPLLLLFSFMAFYAVPSSGQVVFTPGTYYVIPPTSGCNGVWAIQNSAVCSIVALNPCWSSGYVNGDTLFLNLCSLPCNYTSITPGGSACPTQICDYAPCIPPTAGFIASDTSLCILDSIQVFNTSINAVSYQWSVPGATPASSPDVHPYFHFPATGTYAITLVAVNPDGATDTTSGNITVNVAPQPMASFSADAIVSLSAQPVVFTNNSTGTTGCSWDFSDGSTSSDFEPVHIFSQAGTYSVALVASNGGCPDDTTWQDIVVVDDLSTGYHGSSAFLVYPNPATHVLTVVWKTNPSEQFADLYFCDVHGRVMMTFVHCDTGQNLEIDLDQRDIAPGIYFLVVNTAETTTTQKLIVR